MTRFVDDDLLRKSEWEVAAVLVHLKKLLCVTGNRWYALRSCSSPPRLSSAFCRSSWLIWTHLHADIWRSIYGTCHRIHKIMYSATELWWRMDWAKPFGWVRFRRATRLLCETSIFLDPRTTTIVRDIIVCCSSVPHWEDTAPLCVKQGWHRHLITKAGHVRLRDTVPVKGIWEPTKNTLGFAGSSSFDEAVGVPSKGRCKREKS